MSQKITSITDYHSIQISKETDNMKINPNKNTIVCGDNLEWLEAIPDESIDLCYIDPPFFSNRNYEIVWGNGAEVRSFGDRFSGGIEKYIDWMTERVCLIHKKLKSTGSIFLHCDHHASHRLRCMLDEIFGKSNFRNEIIWCYNVGGKSKECFAQKHDNIFWYSKTNNYFFDGKACGVPRETGTNSFGGKIGIDENGRKYQDKKAKSGKYYRYYLDEPKIPEDWWIGINSIQSQSKERIGYPTQKPEKLIERIIKCASQEGDVVLDCFVGGGTTAKVCYDLNRKFIAGDVSPIACKVTIDRLYKSYPNINIEVKNLPTTEEEFRAMDGHKFAEMFCDLVGWKINEKKSDDGGIDGWDANGIPVQIKNHKNDTGRPDIQKFLGSLLQHNYTEGKFVSWGFSKQAIECIMKVKREQGIIIEPIKCADRLVNLIITKEKKLELEALYEQKVGKKNDQADLEPAS